MKIINKSNYILIDGPAGVFLPWEKRVWLLELS